jgi:hypothetical protein
MSSSPSSVSECLGVVGGAEVCKLGSQLLYLGSKVLADLGEAIGASLEVLLPPAGFANAVFADRNRVLEQPELGSENGFRGGRRRSLCDGGQPML